MPRKRRDGLLRRAKISDCALFYASDGLWGVDEPYEALIDGYRYPTVQKTEQCRIVWNAVRQLLLPEWVRERPGTRPSWWFLFDETCPRISAEDIARYKWHNCYWLTFMPDLRRRLGGIGDPKFLHLNYTPEFRCAIPDDWMTSEDVDSHKVGAAVDPLSPPRFESQPAYLDRHGLLMPSEKRRLTPEDFEPETIEE